MANLKPGDMKAYIMHNGTIKVALADMIDSDDRTPLDMPTYTVLIKHPDGYVLFDCATTINPEWQSQTLINAVGLEMKKDEEVPATLARIGVKPEEIKYVVISHFHPDHIGFMDRFPNAKIVIAESEFLGTLKWYASGNCFWAGDVEWAIRSKLNWMLIPDDQKTVRLMEGITVYNFGPGHSFGMLGMLIELPKTGNVLIISDAVALKICLGPPPRGPAHTKFREGYDKTITYCYELAKKENAQIWYGHDVEWYNTMKKSDEGYYD